MVVRREHNGDRQHEIRDQPDDTHLDDTVQDLGVEDPVALVVVCARAAPEGQVLDRSGRMAS